MSKLLKTEEVVDSEKLEQEILQVIKTKTVRLFETDYSGIYGYRGHVCCLLDGMDVDFLNQPIKQQKAIHRAIKEGFYQEDNTVQ